LNLILKQGLIYRRDDKIIFDTQSGRMINLNDSANDILGLLADNICVEKIIELLSEKYNKTKKEQVHT